jgi:hypothetical protein
MEHMALTEMTFLWNPALFHCHAIGYYGTTYHLVIQHICGKAQFYNRQIIYKLSIFIAFVEFRVVTSRPDRPQSRTVEWSPGPNWVRFWRWCLPQRQEKGEEIVVQGVIWSQMTDIMMAWNYKATSPMKTESNISTDRSHGTNCCSVDYSSRS